jgi:ubiquinone/menaquinone biosynthesis C-methylase UbiE
MNKKIIEKKEIKRWWEYKRQLRWKNIYKKKDHSSLALNNRMEMILNYFEKYQKKKIRILEIGFGGGQLAYHIIKKGFNYEGIDVSETLTKVARKRCKKFSKRKYSFKVGSMEEPLKYKKSSFDIVIVAGVLQYALNPDFVFKEIFRVMKKESTFICAQTNFYKLHYFFNFRSLLIRLFYIFSNEQLEISNSLRSLLLETNLKKLFNKSQKNKIKESKFLNKDFVKVDFKFKKRIFYRKKIVNLAHSNGFKTSKKMLVDLIFILIIKKIFFGLSIL